MFTRTLNTEHQAVAATTRHWRRVRDGARGKEQEKQEWDHEEVGTPSTKAGWQTCIGMLSAVACVCFCALR